MVNTLVYKPLVYKGFQWLLYNGTDVCIYELKVTPCVYLTMSLLTCINGVTCISCINIQLTRMIYNSNLWESDDK
jgi:hypothetical protein